MNEELRERCIEVMARVALDEAWADGETLHNWVDSGEHTRSVYRHRAVTMLDALLAVEGTCQTCVDGDWDEWPPCPTCGGSGSDGTPALVGMLMEPSGWFKENGQKIRTYRVRPDTEGEK